MESVAPFAALGALVYTFTNFLKFVSNKEWNAVITQLEVWLAGVVAIFLFGASQIGNFEVPGTTVLLSDMDFWTKLLVGLGGGSLPSVAWDFKKALDDTDTADTSPLLPGVYYKGEERSGDKPTTTTSTTTIINNYDGVQTRMVLPSSGPVASSARSRGAANIPNLTEFSPGDPQEREPGVPLSEDSPSG